MAKAFGDATALPEAEAACSQRSQSHMENVRKSIENSSPRGDGAKTAGERVPNAAREQGDEIGGGDRIDPRLFYFRALLDGDRFFKGGGRF